MTIGKKLYVGFTTILALVVLLFVANVAMLQREHAARSVADSTLRAVGAIGTVRFQIMQNRLFLQNYLLSGDTRETDSLKMGMVSVEDDLRMAQTLASSADAHPALTRVEGAENEWFINFASPLIDKRHQVDSGHMTIAELQIAYLQQNPSVWLKKSTDPLDLAERSIKQTLDESLKTNETAVALTTSVSVTGMVLAAILGLGIAYYTAKSITVPLNRLITVARQIGNEGNLDHQEAQTLEHLLADLRMQYVSFTNAPTPPPKFSASDITGGK